MAKSKRYKIIDPVGVVGFKGVIHKHDDVIDSAQVPPANLKAWIRFGQVEEVAEEMGAADQSDHLGIGTDVVDDEDPLRQTLDLSGLERGDEVGGDFGRAGHIHHGPQPD